MKANLRPLDPSEKALIWGIVGCIGYALLQSLVGDRWAWYIFRAAVLLGIAAVITAAVWKWIERAAYHAEIRRRKLDRMDRENRALDFITMENQAGFYRLNIRTGEARADFRPATPRAVTYHQAAAGIAAPDGRPESVLPILSRADCALVWGGRGAGKTTIAQWAMMEHARAGSTVLVFDPKPHQAHKWPRARVIGSDHDYQGIARALAEVSANLRSGRRITVLIDELNLLNLRIPDFPDLWLPILLEGREYGAGCWIIGQSKTAQSIGLSGRYDLLECFDLVAAAKKDHRTGDRWAEVEAAGMDTERFEMPGPFPSGNGTPPGDLAAAWADPTDETMDAEWTEAGGAGADPDDRPAGRVVSGLLAYFKRPEGGTNQVDAILETLHRSGRAMTPAEIADAAELDKAYTRQALRRLLKAEKVASPRRGCYEIRL
jgi:uncharacterized membrane protein YuzA (DUF378 family)